MQSMNEQAQSGISVVVPCLNEEESIEQVVRAAQEGIARMNLPGEVVVVDNGSTDRSVELARAAGARVVTETIPGYGAALRRGFASARHEIMVMGDADMTYDFTRLDALVQPILDGNAELVVGNRMRNVRPGSMPKLHQYVGNPLLSLMLRLMFHTHTIKDAHCGMRAIRRDVYRRLGCVTTGMEFASEMIVRAIHNRVRMTERDIIYHPRIGESKLQSFRDGWRHMRFLLLHSPSSTLLFPGLAAWIVSLLVAAPLAFGPVVLGGRAFDIHMMIVAGTLNIVSIQLLTFGLLSKAFAHLAGLRDDPLIAWLYKHFTFEKFMLITLPPVAAALWVVGVVIHQWSTSGFGPLNQIRPLFLALICMINGMQMAAGGYLFSIMALPRHRGRFTPGAQDHPPGPENG